MRTLALVLLSLTATSPPAFAHLSDHRHAHPHFEGYVVVALLAALALAVSMAHISKFAKTKRVHMSERSRT